MVDEETGPHDMQEMTLDLLKEIRDKIDSFDKRLAKVECSIDKLENRQGKVEKKLGVLAVDVNTVHKFQTQFTGRLAAVEAYCVEQPLRSTPVPVGVGGDSEGR